MARFPEHPNPEPPEHDECPDCVDGYVLRHRTRPCAPSAPQECGTCDGTGVQSFESKREAAVERAYQKWKESR